MLAVLGLAEWYCVTASTWVRLKEVFGVWCLVFGIPEGAVKDEREALSPIVAPASKCRKFHI